MRLSLGRRQEWTHSAYQLKQRRGVYWLILVEFFDRSQTQLVDEMDGTSD